MGGSANRRKGHQFERDVVNKFKGLGFSFCRTSRAGNRTLDDSKVDIDMIPYNVQCKKGYTKGINYTALFKQMKEGLESNFPPKHEQHTYPSIILHDKGRKPDEKLVIIQEKDFWTLMKKIKEND
jgi:hypothetical protein